MYLVILLYVILMISVFLVLWREALDTHGCVTLKMMLVSLFYVLLPVTLFGVAWEVISGLPVWDFKLATKKGNKK